jgi:N-acetylmuramoyl-L-alanine amidase
VFDLYPPTRPTRWSLIAERLRGPTPAAPGPGSAAPAAEPAPDTLGELIARQIERANQAVRTGPRARARHRAAPSRRPSRLIIVASTPATAAKTPAPPAPAARARRTWCCRSRSGCASASTRQRGRQPHARLLTRDADFFVPLATRVSKARRVQADLFVSIHADAFTAPTPRRQRVRAVRRGASSTAARWLANKENEADRMGGLNVDDKDWHVQRALLDMSTTAQINDSLKLADAVLRRDRHHRPPAQGQRGAGRLCRAAQPRHAQRAGRDRLHQQPRGAPPAQRRLPGPAGRRAGAASEILAANPPLARNRAV